MTIKDQELIGADLVKRRIRAYINRAKKKHSNWLWADDLLEFIKKMPKRYSKKPGGLGK